MKWADLKPYTETIKMASSMGFFFGSFFFVLFIIYVWEYNRNNQRKKGCQFTESGDMGGLSEGNGEGRGGEGKGD